MSELSWKARWIGFGQHPKDDLGVFKFRRTFVRGSTGPMKVKVSADQRYQLFVNSRFVGDGPQRGDLAYWHYETYDLEPFLVAGKNVVEATVWSFGRYAPMAQHTYRLAFVLEGDGISTPDGWEVAPVDGHDFEMMHNEVGGFYIDVGPGEIVTSPPLPLEWRKPNVIAHVLERGEWAGDSPWCVVPRSIPAMKREEWSGSANVVDRTTNERRPFGSLMVHPGEKALLDFGELLAAYPKLTFEGEPGTTVKVTYGEGLFDKNGQKNDRGDVRGKSVRGYQDHFVISGAKPVAANFETLWWRTWRYLQVESDKPVRLSSCQATQTGYPYAVESSFTADDPWVDKIWDVGLRTAKLCAGETYFDCPYYEQLQYVGDTRIQTLIHYYLSRDRALQRNAVEQFARSILPNGLTQSRYPSRVVQIIPPFSLFWILMLRDQMLHDSFNERTSILRSQEAGVILDRFPEPDGQEPFWFFFDWVDGWDAGVPPKDILGVSVVALKNLAKAALGHLISNGGPNWTREILRGEYESVLGVCATDWRAGLRVVEESHKTKDGLLFEETSEHIEALYRVLREVVGEAPAPWPGEALERTKAPKCTYYFQYYKHQAMQPDDYMAELEPWKDMIRNGLTTFAEAPEPTRSDCHAWSAHPLLGFFQLIAGVSSTSPSWKSAKIAPKPGKLKEFDARIAHPDGDLTVRWKRGHFVIESPVPYEFVWNGKSVQAGPGKSQY